MDTQGGVHTCIVQKHAVPSHAVLDAPSVPYKLFYKNYYHNKRRSEAG